VFPGDIAFNAERLAPVFHDIELVFFQSSDACNFPDPGTISILKELSAKYGTTYTVHFPIDKKAGSADASERDGFYEQVRSLVDLTSGLNLFGYILHLEGIQRRSTEAETNQWLKCAHETCQRIVSIKGLEASRICLENLDYPVAWNEISARNFGFSLCLDLGHLFLYKDDWRSIAAALLPQTRVIHFHGVSEGKDHVSVKKLDQDLVNAVAREVLSKFTGVLTIETFNETDTFESVETMQRIWQQ
jgi:sugar phosphate isomerase/epimerase